MAVTKTRNQGKTSFVKEMLFDNDQATHKLVNEAWLAAGMPGTISESLVKAVRSDLGLTGNTRKRSKSDSTKVAAKSAKTTKVATKAKPAAKTKAKAISPVSVKTPRAARSRNVIVEAEADIDRLIFKLMNVGGFSEIEDALRGVRRKLVFRGQKG
jgi:hypothetical protein